MKNPHLILQIYILLFSLAFITSCHGQGNSSLHENNTLAQENQKLGRMWTFENPPLAYLEKEYGFKPDQEWLDSLRLGSLRLGGEDVLPGFGSASFVSPKGLIMTSTRCVRDAVADTRQRDIYMIKTGFVAAELEDEFRLRSRRDEWLTAAQLYKISNVTDKVNKGVTPTDTETQIKEKREANKQTILDAARKADPELVPQIVSLYQGGMFQLYQYKVYDDVRLVVLPHVQTAHFGGDADNFTYPRHSIDFAFLRAYEDGKPANTTKHYFKWRPGGAKKDELVFVSGNPGTTKRLSTKAQLELERDVRIPIEIERLTNRLPIMKNWGVPNDGEYDPENPSRYWAWMRTGILATENSLKAALGNLQGLENAKLMAEKTAAEQAFKSRVMGDKKLAEKYGDLWDRIASVVEEQRQHEARARFQTTDGSPMLGMAVAIVRMCDPAETEEYRKQAKKNLEILEIRAGMELHYNDYGIALFVDRLVRARSWLPRDDPFFSKVLGGKSAEEFFDVLAPPLSRRSPSWLGYAVNRDALIKSGWKAIQDSEDPAMVAARELVILIRKNEKLGDELDAKEEALGAEMARALFACYGQGAGSDGLGSDGTMTPRFTDGVVRGFPSNGTLAPYRTTFYGLYARNAEFDNEYPFNLPKIWLDRKDKIDMTKPVNFVSTNDITRGNMALDTPPYRSHRWRYTGGTSGSVVVNKALEVVGVVVDGNIESLHNDFVFKDDVPRAVSAHVDGIMEALVKIYDAHRVAKELTGK